MSTTAEATKPITISSVKTITMDPPSPTLSVGNGEIKGLAADLKKKERYNNRRVSETEFADPLCSPNDPVQVTFQDVTSAAFMIRNGVEKTSCNVSFKIPIFFFNKKNYNFFLNL